MREALRDPGRLQHMMTAIDNVFLFMQGHTEDDLFSQGVLYFAVVKNLEIIGEAAYMLTPEFREAHPETVWRKIIAMRHILVHGYYQVEPSEIWEVVQKDLPELRRQILSYLTA